MEKGLALIPIFCLILAGMKGTASNGQPVDGNSYVVIGAFSIPKNAMEFTESAKRKKLGAQFSINPSRNLFYVYVMETHNREDAFEAARKIRKETSYFDTWVYTGSLGEESKG